jgi:hypothetical protein
MTIRIRTLLPPGGFSNLVGHYVAALDIGSAHTRAAAEESSDAGATCAVLREIGTLESEWIHTAVGGVPTPPAPEDDVDIGAWLGWLEAVRTISVMVLRPKQDRELESFVVLEHESAELGPRTLKRLLAELLYEQGRCAGRIPQD